MTFPQTELEIHVQALLGGEWIDFGPVAHVVDDFYTDEYLDEYLGRNVWDLRRLPSQDITINHGRQDEADRTSPANVSVVLWNEDGYLTPTDTRSPWFPDWDVNCQFRILVGDDIRFWGEVSSIRPEWPQGDISDVDPSELDDLGSVPVDRLGYAHVIVEASGSFRRLSQRTKPLRSCLHRRVVSPTVLGRVTDYFSMEDGAEASTFAAGIPNESRPPMTYSGHITLASDSGLLGSEPLPVTGSGESASWRAVVNGFSGHGVVEVFLKMTDRPAPDTIFRIIDVSSDGAIARVTVEVIVYAGYPGIRVRAFDSGGTMIDQSIASLFGSVVFFTENWMQMRLTLTESGGATAWNLAWWTVTIGVDPGNGFGDTFAGGFGQVTGIGGSVDTGPENGVGIGHYILHDGIAAGWLVGYDVGGVGEPARNRIFRLCSEEGVPSYFTSGADNRSLPMGTQRALPFLELLQECADADRGILNEPRAALGVGFVHRRFRYNQTPTFVLDAAESEIANPFTPTRDDQGIRNDVTMTRVNGSSARLIDEESVEKFGLYDEQLTLNVGSDLLVRHMAGWQLHMGADAGIRLAQLTMDLTVAPQLVEQWDLINHTGLEISVINLPPQLEMESLDLVVQGWSETLTAHSWTVTLNCTPADPWKVATWGESLWDDPTSILGL